MIYDDVIVRILSIGYTATEDDRPIIQQAIDRAEQYIKNNTNQHTVPEALRFVWIDMAAGTFLLELKAAGQLDSFVFETPVKSISEGDTSVTFMGISDGILSPEVRFDNMLKSMATPPQEQLAAYRRMRW